MPEQKKNISLYPLFIKLAGRAVLVVGGGSVATRKVCSLLKVSACVTVVSPDLTDDLQRLCQENQIKYVCRAYQPGDLDGAELVFVACDDDQVSRRIADECQKRHILCNVADVPELCSFYVPAVIERGQLQIAISTGGISPALAKRIRQQFEAEFDETYETFLNALAELRRHVKQKHPDDQVKRADILESFVNSDALEHLKNKDTAAFDELLKQYQQR